MQLSSPSPLPPQQSTRTEDVDQDALRVRRERALANPLQIGDSLSRSGPPLDLLSITPSPNDVFSLHDQAIAAQSPNPYRAPISRLRDLVSRTPPSRSLHFKLGEPIRAGSGKWAQIWKATALRGEERTGPVVVKLLAEALFPQPLWEGWWKLANDSAQAETAAYKAFRFVQGRDVPHHYGTFLFEMPWGESVYGVVLEDLSASSVSLSQYCAAHKSESTTIDEIEEIVIPAFDLLERLHHLGITRFDPDTYDLHVLATSSPPTYHFVWLDFGETVSVETERASCAEQNAELEGMGAEDFGGWQDWHIERVEDLFAVFFGLKMAALCRRALEEDGSSSYMRMMRERP